MPLYTPKIPLYTGKEVSSAHKLGLKIAKAYFTLSFADYTKEKRPNSQWLRFIRDVRSQVLKQVPLITNINGFLIK